MPRLVVATRRSALALAQTRAFVRDMIAANPGLEVDELQVVTSGDRIQDRPLYEVGGKGLFVKEIEEALLDRRADLAVHSMKDLPARQPEALHVACVPPRADPRDVLLVRPGLEARLEALPLRARIGSSSLRRRLAMLRVRPDLEVVPLRGNVDTRLRKVTVGELDAIVLAAAGLARLGVETAALPSHVVLPSTTMLPAVAQGILAIETRVDDVAVATLLAPLDHGPSRLRAWAERGVLQALDADCTVPLAAHATLDGDRLHLEAWLTELDGSGYRSAEDTSIVTEQDGARAFGLRLGATLRAPR